MQTSETPLNPRLEEKLDEILQSYKDTPLLRFSVTPHYNKKHVKSDIETVWSMLDIKIDKPLLETAIFSLIATLLIESYYQGNNRPTDFAQFISLSEYIKEIIKKFDL